MGADRDPRIEHGLDPQHHGLSLERIELDPPFAVSGLFDDEPAVGSNFVEVVALLRGNVMLNVGARLPDSYIERSPIGRFPAKAARALAAALVRAADLTERAASSDQSHEALAGEPSALPSHREDAAGGFL